MKRKSVRGGNIYDQNYNHQGRRQAEPEAGLGGGITDPECDR